MPRGGPRPGAGRKSSYYYHVGDKRYDSLKEAAEAEGVSTKTIHNWCRPENEKRSDCRMESKTDEEKQLKREIPDKIKQEAENANMTPLDYMLNIMRDEVADKKRRDTMAYWAAPYIHPKADKKKGKKDERAGKAQKAGSGKFKPSKAPHLKVSK